MPTMHELFDGSNPDLLRIKEEFCDSHCNWLDHHPDCTYPVGYLGVNKQGEIGKFRTSHFNGAMPVYAHPKIANECIWTEDGDGFWETSCGNTFVVEDGTPYDNKMKFCPYCGGNLREVIDD